MEDKNYNKKVAFELRTECRLRGLSSTGNKGELVARLVNNDEENEPAAIAQVFDDVTDPDGREEKKSIFQKYKAKLDAVDIAGNAKIASIELTLKQAKAKIVNEKNQITREKSVQDKAVDDRVMRLREKIKAANKHMVGSKQGEESNVDHPAKGLQPLGMGGRALRTSDVRYPGFEEGELDGTSAHMLGGGSSMGTDEKYATAAEILQNLDPGNKCKDTASVSEESAVEPKKVRTDLPTPSANDEEPTIDARPELIESSLIEPTLGKMSYITLSSDKGTTRGDAVENLKIRLGPFQPLRVRVDAKAYFVFFADTKEGDSAMSACLNANDGGFWIADTKWNVQLVGRGLDSDSDSDSDSD